MNNEIQKKELEENAEEVQVLAEESEKAEVTSLTVDQVAHIIDKVCQTYDSTLDVGKELKGYHDVLPASGYAFRETLIREATDMSTSEKLAASRENDNFELERLSKVKDVANEARDNKTKNAVALLAICGLPAAFGIAMCFPGSRAFIVAGIKSGMKYIPTTVSAA